MLRRARAHSAGLLAVGVLMAAVLGCSAPAEAAPRYVASTATIANPERGFYHHQTGHCDDVWHPFKVATLQNYRGEEKITLVMCIFYLTKDDGTPDQHGGAEPDQPDPDGPTDPVRQAGGDRAHGRRQDDRAVRLYRRLSRG
jgi:hypothetical protein